MPTADRHESEKNRERIAKLAVKVAELEKWREATEKALSPVNGQRLGNVFTLSDADADEADAKHIDSAVNASDWDDLRDKLDRALVRAEAAETRERSERVTRVAWTNLAQNAEKASVRLADHIESIRRALGVGREASIAETVTQILAQLARNDDDLDHALARAQDAETDAERLRQEVSELCAWHAVAALVMRAVVAGDVGHKTMARAKACIVEGEA